MEEKRLHVISLLNWIDQLPLTKNDRLHCDARLACHKLKLPSPSAIPNLLPCCEKRHRVTLANVPGGRGVQTTCWCPHSHIWTEPSWPPVKYNGINGWAHIRFILSTLCFNTFAMNGNSNIKEIVRLAWVHLIYHLLSSLYRSSYFFKIEIEKKRTIWGKNRPKSKKISLDMHSAKKIFWNFTITETIK